MSRKTKATQAIIKIVRKRKLSAEDFKDVTKRVREIEGLTLVKKRKRVDIDYLPHDEVQHLIETAYGISESRGVMVRTMYESATRVSAFCALEIRDVLFDRNMIHVRNGKGGKDRLIPLSPEMMGVLREYVGDRTEGPLFPSQNGGHYSRRRMQQIVTDIGLKAGLHVYPHKLRKSRSMWFLAQKMPMKAISQFLGHADTSVTEQHYANMGVSMVADAFQEVYARLKKVVSNEQRKAA